MIRRWYASLLTVLVAVVVTSAQAPTVPCSVTSVGTYSDKDAKLTVRCDTNGTVVVTKGTTLTLSLPAPPPPPPPPTPDPPPTPVPSTGASPDGTRGLTITDAAGHLYALAADAGPYGSHSVLRDGASLGAYGTEFLYLRGQVFFYSPFGYWYSIDATGVVSPSAVGDPFALPAPPPPAPTPGPAPVPVPPSPTTDASQESAIGTLATTLTDRFLNHYRLDTAPDSSGLGREVLRNEAATGGHGVHFYYGRHREVLFQTASGYWYEFDATGAVSQSATLMPLGLPPPTAAVLVEAPNASPDGTVVTASWTPLTVFSGRQFILSDILGTKDGGAHFIGYEVCEVFAAKVPGLAEDAPLTPATTDGSVRPATWLPLDANYQPIADERLAVHWALRAGELYGYAFKLVYKGGIYYQWSGNGRWYYGVGGETVGFATDPFAPPEPPEVLLAPMVGTRALVGGWRFPFGGGNLANPGTGQNNLAIDFDTMRAWVSNGSQGPGDLGEFQLPPMGLGPDPSKWPLVQPTRMLPAWWGYGYSGGLYYGDLTGTGKKLWAVPKVYYDTAPPPTLDLYAQDGEHVVVNLPRQAYAGFVKRAGGQRPYLGGGGDESGSGGIRGPTLATLDGRVLITYGRPFALAEPGDPLAHWNDIAPRDPNYFAGDHLDSWVSFEPRVIDGVLQGRWAADRVFGGGLVLPEGITYFPWMATGSVDYGRQEPTFGVWALRRTYRYVYNPTTFALTSYEKTGLGEVRGQELGPDGSVYLSFMHLWPLPGKDLPTSTGSYVGVFR